MTDSKYIKRWEFMFYECAIVYKQSIHFNNIFYALNYVNKNGVQKITRNAKIEEK